MYKIFYINNPTIPNKYFVLDNKNHILPISSGIRGLDSKLAFIETCKKIYIKKDFVKILRKKGWSK